MKTLACLLFLAAFLAPREGQTQWHQIDRPSEAIVSCLAANDRYLLAGHLSGGVFRSSDNGSSWVQSGLAGIDIKVLAAGPDHIYAGTDGGVIYHSSDDARTWREVQSGYEAGVRVNDLAVTDSRLYLLSTCTQGGGGARSILSVSTDYGATWTSRETPGTWGMALLAYQKCLLISTDAGLYRSKDNGATWTKIGFEKICVNALARVGPIVFAGADCGVYCCSDLGFSLGVTGLELRDIGIALLAADESFVYAVTTGNTMWRRSLPDVVVPVKEARTDVPEGVVLHGNYPNPFNPSTTLSYYLPTRSHVSLKVYDLLGSEIATLVNEVREGGEHAVRFDATGLASGQYFYRLTAGQCIQTKKMVLTK